MTREKDIRVVCETVLSNWENVNAQNRYHCNYCFGHHGDNNPTKTVDGYPHALDCPVLVATDLLT